MSAAFQREFSDVGCYYNFTVSLSERKQPISQVRLPPQRQPQTQFCSLCQGRLETLPEKCDETMNDTSALRQIRLEGSVHFHRISCLKPHDCSDKKPLHLRQTVLSAKVTS